MQNLQDTITAPATPAGVSALAVVRVSGNDAIAIANKCFDKDIITADGYTIHYGHIVDGDVRVDEVLVSVFRNPHSYTGEDSVEISSHGSPYITSRIIETLRSEEHTSELQSRSDLVCRLLLEKKKKKKKKKR